MSTTFAIIMSLVSLLTPAERDKAEFCQAYGGQLYNVDTSECVVVTVAVDDAGNEQATFKTYTVQQQGTDY